MSGADQDRLAPVDVLVIEFPEGQLTPRFFSVLDSLIERHVIHVLDLEFVRKDGETGVHLIEAAEALAGSPEAASDLAGASSGLLDRDDVAFVGEALEPGSIAAVVLYEHVWITPLVEAVEAGRARIVTAARVNPQDLLAALEAEPAPTNDERSSR